MTYGNDELFWLENPTHLFRKLIFIPKPEMTTEEQMNCITRIVCILFFILYMIEYTQAFLFFILSIIFIIILYYLQKSKDTRMENFMESKRTYIDQSEQLYQQGKNEHINNRYTYVKYPSYFSQQVEKPYTIAADQTFQSNNQKLVGKPNPKTQIAPVIPPPTYEWHYWKDNDLVVPNIINEKPVKDYYGSGYYINSCQKTTQPDNPISYKGSNIFVSNDRILRNSSIDQPLLNPNTKADQKKSSTMIERFTPTPKTIIENFTYLDQPAQKKECKSCTMPDPSTTVSPQNLINGDFKKFDQKNGDEKKVRYAGDVIESLGYDETNLQYNLPSNLDATNCQRRPAMSEINKQIFTSTIVPGVYAQNQIIEPIDYNVGISFAQQIPPRQVDTKNGQTIYTSMDPKLYTPIESVTEPLDVPSTYDIYDPRSNGYGTSYRGYTDKLTGRPRFFYDDVDAVRRPNYITRTEIDHLKNVDTYGPVRSDDDIRASNDVIRELAENSFRDQTLDFRTDMMTRLMRKRNAEMWQLRIAPKAGMKK